ncbi:MAG TPA: hypothetical protein VF339_04245 [Gammaproteobacteria bacterium]
MIGRVFLVRPEVDDLRDDAGYAGFQQELAADLMCAAVQVDVDPRMPLSNELSDILSEELHGIIVRVDIDRLLPPAANAEIQRFKCWLRGTILSCRILALAEYRDAWVRKEIKTTWSDYRARCEWLRAAVIVSISKRPRDEKAADALRKALGLDSFRVRSREVVNAYCGTRRAPGRRRPVALYLDSSRVRQKPYPFHRHVGLFTLPPRRRNRALALGRTVLGVFGRIDSEPETLDAVVLTGCDVDALQCSFGELRERHAADALRRAAQDHFPFLLVIQHGGGDSPSLETVRDFLKAGWGRPVQVELLDWDDSELDGQTSYYVVRVADVPPASSGTAETVRGLGRASR